MNEINETIKLIEEECSKNGNIRFLKFDYKDSTGFGLVYEKSILVSFSGSNIVEIKNALDLMLGIVRNMNKIEGKQK